MLDLPAADAAAAPAHWLQAPLPNAPLWLARQDRLIRGERHESIPVSPALLAHLNRPAAVGEVLIAYDTSGEAWRLRHAGDSGAETRLWLAQALNDSRARLFSGLRSVLAMQLTECVLHELRNPLNALSLHADLMARVLAGGGAVERALPSVEVIRQRVGDLRRRQDAAVALWLGDAAQPEMASADLRAVVDDSLRLVRGHLALQEVRLRSEALDLIGTARLRGGGAQTRLALMALLLMACAGAGQYRGADGGAEVLVQAIGDGNKLILELQAPLDGQTLGRELADTDTAGLMATLALLLESAGIAVEADPVQAVTRLSLAG
ncbi:MAG: sensor histidine kinase [Nevskia sp.]|nr:sensor histidine kinase [Nevskia sp.]